MNDVIYTAKHGGKGNALSLLYSVSFFIFFAFNTDSLVRVWGMYGWIMRCIMIFFIFTIVLMPMESFLTRTIFTSTSIIHRSMFGAKTNKTYKDIEKIYLDLYFLQILFKDGKKIKIWKSRGDLGKIKSIIDNRLNNSIGVSQL